MSEWKTKCWWVRGVNERLRIGSIKCRLIYQNTRARAHTHKQLGCFRKENGARGGQEKEHLPHKYHNLYLNESLKKFNMQNFPLKLTQLDTNTINHEIDDRNFETNKN